MDPVGEQLQLTSPPPSLLVLLHAMHPDVCVSTKCLSFRVHPRKFSPPVDNERGVRACVHVCERACGWLLKYVCLALLFAFLQRCQHHPNRTVRPINHNCKDGFQWQMPENVGESFETMATAVYKPVVRVVAATNATPASTAVFTESVAALRQVQQRPHAFGCEVKRAACHLACVFRLLTCPRAVFRASCVPQDTHTMLEFSTLYPSEMYSPALFVELRGANSPFYANFVYKNTLWEAARPLSRHLSPYV